MSRIRINQYKVSKGAKALAEYLNVKRLKVRGSRFIGRASDVVINWGMGKGNIGNARQINKLENVQLASNKHSTLHILKSRGISVPDHDPDARWLENGRTYLARTSLHGYGGEGIEVFTASADELYPNAPLYVEYIEKVAEYRVIVVGDEAVDTKKKLKKNSYSEDNPDGYRGTHNPHVWNLEGGYIMARNGFEVTDELKQLGVDAVKALGLDFGAVDIIEDGEGKLYVLEVNTAFGLEGTTISLVGDAIKELL